MKQYEFEVDFQNPPWVNNIFNGKWSKASGGVYAVNEPATGDELLKVGFANITDLDNAARQAKASQQEWCKLNPRDRASIFQKAGNWFADNRENIVEIIIRETGAIRPKAEFEVNEAITILQMSASIPLKPDGITLPSIQDRLSIARRLPRGVVGVISPFNFPLILSIRAVAPALGYCNSVIIKPDPRTPVIGGHIIAAAFKAAGLPNGVLHVLPGRVDVGEGLCTNDNVDMVAFTGSTPAGRRVGELCGQNLKKVSLELGGKNSLVILDDADINLAASNIAWGAYLHQGQVCMATGRVLVHEKIVDKILSVLIEKARSLPVGNPAKEEVALGPIIDEKQLNRIDGIVKDTISAGAILHAGGEIDGPYYKPTVISHVRPGMRAFEEEIFGPVASITEFKDDVEAIELANSSEYGLSAGIISKSTDRAILIGEQLNAGMLHINDQTVNDEAINPFGGKGCSGNGSAAGATNYEDEFTEWKWITLRSTPQAYPF